MVPTIGLIQIDWPPMADRYAYISYIGLFIMVCWTVAEWADAQHCPTWVLTSISLAVLFILSVLSRHQISYWSDSVTLWTHSAQVTRPNWSADLNLGYALQQRRESKEALDQFYKAAQDKPDNVETDLDIALVERERGNSTQAIVYYKKALTVSKDDRLNAQVWANMGHAYSALGDEVDARECYLKSVSIHGSAPVPPPRRVINWHGAWWRDLGPFMHSFISSH
jgi:Tfp pilus assembly protein PilF